ncbi:hypothetical protein SAMN05216368_1322 [Cryobacterium flavum]|uniref:Uncharacterized protein n=1 Tax=Cryobacterium flavum TaxID=1424659 RepID=A0A5E9G505_9MICO|nr:hypothetical protein SAMN05216368_1322 [Cryobacterium flavum]
MTGLGTKMPCNSNRPVDIQATHAAKFHARGFVLDVVAFEEPPAGQSLKSVSVA